MKDYLLVSPKNEYLFAIRHEGNTFLQLRLNPSALQADPILQGEELIDAIKRVIPSWGTLPTLDECKLLETQVPAGQYFPRIARPVLTTYGGQANVEPEKNPPIHDLESLKAQLTVLVRELQRICQTVHPCGELLTVYGHDIRNLLILACTEVELHWRSVLENNGVSEENLTTNQYVELADAMKLADYSISFPRYPWLKKSFQPFKNWSGSKIPSQDLAWYYGYNQVKHHRLERFSEGNLGHVFEAIAACAIMFRAQFGKSEYLNWRAESGIFIDFVDEPVWLLSEHYIYVPGLSTPTWASASYPFAHKTKFKQQVTAYFKKTSRKWP